MNMSPARWKRTWAMQLKDHLFVQGVALFYCMIITLVALTLNVNAMIPAKDVFSFSSEYKDRIHETVLSLYMILGIVLMLCNLRHIWWSRGVEQRYLNTILPGSRAEPLLTKRVIVLLWILVLVAMLSSIREIVSLALLTNCAELTEISLNLPHRTIRLVSLYLYDALLIVYLGVQAYLCTVLNSRLWRGRLALQETMSRQFLAFWMFCHCMSTNGALYIKITLHEAKHTLYVETHADCHNCGSSGDSHTNCTAFQESLSKQYLELLGFAMTTEALGVMTLAMWTLMHASRMSVNAHQGISSLSLKNKRHLRQMPTRTVSNLGKLKLLPRRWAQLLICGLCLLVAMGIAFKLLGTFIVYIFTESGDYANFLKYTIPMFALMAVPTFLCWWDQLFAVRCATADAEEMCYHAKLDIKLLHWSSASVLAYIMFMIQSALYSSSTKDLPGMHANMSLLNATDLGYPIAKKPSPLMKMLQLGDSVFNTFQVSAQVLMLSRAMGYKSYEHIVSFDHKLRPGWLLEILCTCALLVLNLVFYIINLLARKNEKLMNITAKTYYPTVMWAYMHEICYPVIIFFRFHSFVVTLTLIFNHIKNLREKKRQGYALVELFGLARRHRTYAGIKPFNGVAESDLNRVLDMRHAARRFSESGCQTQLFAA